MQKTTGKSKKEDFVGEYSGDTKRTAYYAEGTGTSIK